MPGQEIVARVGRGLIGGYVGTKVMEPVSMWLYQWESAHARQQEDAVRPGPPYEIAARKTTALLGLELSDRQIQTLGTTLFHYGLGVGWGAVYPLLRLRPGLPPVWPRVGRSPSSSTRD